MILSRNNHQEQFKKYEPKKQRFTIKKLSVGVASVLLGISFANGVSADTTDNANVNSGGDKNGSSEETDHNLVLNSASASTLKEATAANQANNASAAVQNPAGDVTTPTANKYEAAVSAAMANATTPDTTADSNAASQGSQSTTPAQPSANSQATTDSTINQPTSNAVETQTFNVADAANATNGFDYSSLFTSLFAQSNSSNADATATSFDDITANAKYNIPTQDDLRGVQVQQGQTVYRQTFIKQKNLIVTFATDTNDPGKNYYLYFTPTKTESAAAASNDKYAIKTYGLYAYKGDPNNPETLTVMPNQTPTYYTPSGTTQMYTISSDGKTTFNYTINTSNNNLGEPFTGGTYTFEANKQPLSGVANGINAIKWKVTPQGDTPELTFGSSVSLELGSNNNQLYGLWNINQDKKQTLDEIAKDGASQWKNVSSWVPAIVNQPIYYVDADTGKLLGTKNELIKGLSGQSYEITGNLNPEKVTFDDGKIYTLVSADDASAKSKAAVVTTNGKTKILASDLTDGYTQMQQDGKLTGTLSMYNKGNQLAVGITGPIPLVYFKTMLDNQGTAEYNTYKVDPEMGTQFMSGLSGKTVKKGDVLSQDGNREINDSKNGNSGFIFYYRIKQNATITFVDDDNGSSLSPAQDATGDADTQITFDNAASTVSNILGQGYTYVQTTGNGVTGGNTGSFSGVTFPAYDSDDNTTQSFVVHFKKAAPTVSYTYGEPESVTIHRTINYYDKVTGAKIPSNLIAQNPVTDEVTFTRTPVLENGVKVGYGTINAEGTGYTKQDWHTADGEVGSTQFAAKRSNDLSAYNYTAPEFKDGKSANVVPADTVTPTTKDIVYDVYYGHQTQPVNNTKTVTRHFHYVFTDSSDPASKLTPQTDQTVTFNGTATKDLVTGKISDTVYTPATGTLAQVKGQAVDGYKIVGYTNGTPDGGAVALNVTPTSGDTDVTIVYTPIDKPKPQADEKASVKIVDQDTNKTLGTFKNQGVAGDNITFAGEPETLTTLINSGYTWVSAVNDKNGSSIGTDPSNINFGNFDNDTTTDQAFTITLKHGQKVTNEQGASTATVHYVIAGNDANKPAAPADNGPQTINWTRTVTTDQVTGDITYGNWTPDKSAFTNIASPTVTGYTPDMATATFTTPVVNKDQVVTVVYSKAPEQDQKADLIVYDKTDNNKELNNFNNSGKAGTQITFSGAANYVADLIAKGYQIDSFVNDQNVTSNPSSYSQISYDNFDSNANSDQHFKLYLVHGTEPANQTKNTTSTVHYVVLEGKATPPADHTETITWTQPGTKDKVTGAFTPTGNWTTPDHYTDVPSPSLEGYTVDKTNVPAPTPNPDQNPTTTVTYSPKTPEVPTYTGTDEVRDVTRTINYYDKVTGQKIPADLIHDNPTTQTVQLKRTHVVSSTGQDMGYGTISNDGKTFTKATGDGWNTGSWNQVVSPILTNAGYTAPDLAQADQVNVTAATKDAVVNVYYGHETVLVTPDKPQNPGDKINPNDPRNNPPAYPDGLTKTDLQQSVTRTINYKGINENGQTVDVNGAPDGKNTYTQTVNFERHAVVDKVTGEVLGYDTNADTVTPVVTTTDANRAWMPASQNMASVASKAPSKVGYDNVDLSTVGGMTVYPGQQISDVTVTYTKNKTPEATHKATLEIIDNNDTNAPKQVANFGNEGKSTDQITFANSDQVLQSYLDRGYKVQKTSGALTGDAQSGYTYPVYGDSDQDFKIYLVHDTKEVTENATATAQVHYVVADNGVQAPADSALQTITYSRTNTVDKVTGATVNEGTWKADKNAFTDVKSPDLSNDGYTPSVDNVQFNAPERGVNQRVTVVYNRSAQAADLQIIDDNDPANQSVLAVYSDNGESGKAISFNGSNDQLKKYLANGYVFEKADGQGMSGDATNGFTYPSFDNDAKSNQSFKIYLKHGTKDQTTTAKANAHVHYIIADNGVQAPADSPTQTVTWTRTDTVDAVTGAVQTTGEWGTPSGNFESVKSPEVTGYTPGTKTVNFATPEPNKDQVVNVIYTKNPETPATQKAVVVYQDVNDPAHVVELTRSSELTGNAGDAVNYSTADEIAKLENEGYVLVSNGFDPNGAKPSFDNINDNTQTFYVTLKHGIQPVNPTTPGTPSEPINPNDPDPKGPKYPAGTDKTSLTHDVTRTVTYEGAGEQTPSPVTDTLHFQGAGYLDKVTGKWTDANGKELADQTKGITWTIVDGTKDNGSFDLVPTKHINGYTSQVETAGADDGNGNVKSYTGINHSTADINVIVKYSPVVAEKGNLIVKFHDDTDKKDLTGVGTDTGSQDVGTNVTYNSDTDLTNLENKGYVYVSTDGKIPASIVKGTTTVTIHVKHGLQPVNPSTPGKPDQPINPNDPDPKGPKYPAGTDKASIDKTITRTIHYEGADQYTPSDVQQPVHFTASGVLDKVTGGWATPLTWSSETETFGAKSSPKIPGYHVVNVDRDTTDQQNVDNATISHNGSDYTVTVKYAKDEAPAAEKGSIKVTVHDVKTNQDVPGYDANSGSENVGTKFTYDTAGNIAKLKDAGYKVLNPDVQIPTEISKGDQSFVIYVDHNVVPVTPENPGNGLDKDALQKSVTETVKYVVNGDQSKAPADHTATLHFDGTAYYDSVTKKWTDASGNELVDQTKNITWTANDGHQFDTVISPVVTGYHVTSVSDNYNDGNGNVKAVSGMDQNSSNFTVTVTYDKDAEPTKDQGSLTVIVHDVTDNKDLDEYGKKSGTQEVGYNFEFNKAITISELENKGYKVINPDVTIPTQVTKGDYSYTIYVQHNIVPVTPDKPGNGLDHDQLTKTVTETVHYVVNGGTAKAPADKTASLVFNGTGYYDAVTKQWTDADGKVLADQNKNITWTAQDGNKFSVVVTPRLEGYNASVQEGYDDGNNNVKEISGINQTSNNVDVTVTYTPATPAKTQQNAQLVIQDVTPGQEMQLGSYTQPGLEGDPISFGDAQQRIQDLLGKGYVWDGATYNGANLSATDYAGIAFGNYDNTDDNSGISQKWVINLVHRTTPVNPDHPDDKNGYTKDYLDRTITRDVTYVDAQGNEMKGLTPEHQEAKFTGSGYLDNVTGKWVTVENGKITGLAKGLTWTPDTDLTFNAINAKSAEGYHVVSVTGNGISGFTVGQDGAVTAQTVNRDTPSSKITVVYAPDTKAPVAANGSIVYIDDTTGNTLESASFGGTVGGKINYTTADRVTYYEGKGYNVVSNNFHDGNETFKEGNNKFEVHLTHVTDTKNVTKTVTRDVTYIYEDGSRADTPVNQSVTFNGKTTTDKVTGAEKTVWDNDSQNFAATKSIDTTQYNIVKVSENNTAANVDMTNGVVAGETITPTSQNSKVVITLAKKAIPTPDQGSLTVVFHDDTEGHDIEGYGTKTGNENVGTDVTYKADTDLTNLENKGYVYVSTDGTIPGKITKGATTVTIHVKHGTRPVTPENPADPGKPVDPNKPNTATPSNPNLAKTDLEKAITRTVKYQYTDGTSAHADAVQTVNFKGQGTIDLVTGNLVNVDKDGNIVDQRGKIAWDHDSQDFGNVAAIDHDGYYVSSITETGTTAKVDGTAVAGETVNPNSQNSTIVITLTKKPVTPTPVQKGTVIVNYVDKTTGKTLETATSTGNEGSNVDYSTKDTITKYTNQGYKLEHDGYPTGTVTYTNGTVTYEVDLVHDTVPVNPDQPGPKTPNTPINPNDPNGPKYPDGTQPSQLTKTVTRTINYVGDGLNIPSVQKEVQFVANGVLDKVTGQWVTVDQDGKITGTANGMTWTVKGGNTDEGSFDQVAGPQTDGYYISGISSTNEAASDVDKTTGTVAGKTINHTNGNIVITINYAKNPVTPTPTPADQTVVGKQIVHYVDGDNNNAKLLDDNTNDTFVFTKSGKTGTWNTDSHKYANANAPVIDGYVAEQKTYEGQTATPGDANKEITIVYHKIGKIIPVDPTGNPIPDAPTPGYHNDPTDPTKVTPNEPTPDVPGWTTNVPNVTPDTPTGDTKVPYTKPTPTQDKGSITIAVHDVTDNTDLPEYGKTSGSQNVGTSFSYDKTGTFTSLTNKGYKVVNPDVTIPTGITKGDQNIVIYVEHTTTPITPENPGKPGQPINPNDPTGPQYPNGSDQVTKNVTRTITYVDNNGNKLHDPVEQTAHFTGTGVIDNVTGKWVTPITWTGNGDLNGQNTPVVDGYHVTNVSRDGNGNNVAKVTVNHGDSDYTVVVTYTPNGKIVPVDPTGNPIPNVPTPQYPTDPSDPAKVTPNEPVPTIPGYTPEVPSVTPTNPGEDTPVVYTPVTPATVQGKVTYIDDTTGKTITTDNFSGKVGDKITYTTADKISDLEGKGYELVSNNFKDGSETFTDGENSFVVHLKHAETIFTPQNPHGGDDESGKYATQKKTTFTVHYVGAGEKNPADHVETVQWHRHVSVDGVTGEVISSTPWTTDDSYSNVNTPVVDGYHADKAVANAPQADPDKDSVETVTYAPNGHIIPVDQTGTPIPGADHPVYPTDPNDPTKVTPNEPVPTVPGYTPEQETVTPVDPGTNTPVIYDRGTTPVTPEQPETPGNPGGDDNETPNKVTPNTPANPGDNGNEEGKKVTPQSPATPAENTPAASAEPQAPVAKQAAAQKPAAKSDAKTLPQTGNDENNSAAVLGLAALGLTGLVGLGKKRRKED